MKKSINYKLFYFIFFFSLISLSFYSSLYYVFTEYRDEIGYLSDSMLLAEGLRPSYSHAPSGLSTWFGTFFIFFQFLFLCLKNIFNIDIKSLFTLFDYVLFENYLDLTNIKLSLFFLNIIALLYLLKISKATLYFEYFVLVALSPLLSEITFSGKPYFLGYIFAAIALCLKKSKSDLSLIFLALAICERLEFFLLINFVIKPEFNKNYLKKIFIILLIFAAVSPWFFSAIVQNLKVIMGYVHVQPSELSNYLSINLNIFLFVVLLVGIFFFPFIKKKTPQYLTITVIIFLFIAISYFSNIPLRWFLPVIVIIIYLFLENYKNKLNFLKNKNILNVLSIIFLIFFINNLSNKKSDLDILFQESKHSQYTIIGPKLLKEEGNFSSYSNFLETHLYEFNYKNKFFFKDNLAPLSFGISGNLEILQNRRYEYLSKYNKKNFYSKYIFSDAGLYKNKDFYCSKFKLNAYYYNFSEEKYKICKKN